MSAPVDVRALGRVAVLLGGSSGEREVSLQSGGGVLAALQERGVDAHGVDPAHDDILQLRTRGFNRCFIALHGRGGEDGTLQGLLDYIGLPYTGPGVMPSSIAMDKVMTKRVWLTHGLATPKWVDLDMAAGPARWHEQVEGLGWPLIVKPSLEGSSLGVSRVAGPEGLEAAVREASPHHSPVMAEQFIAGRELTCGVVGQGADARALPVIHIEAPGGNYDFEHKYISNDTRYHCPSGLPPATEAQVRELVVQAYRALGCRGWSRADIMLRASDNAPFLLEINTSPGMTSHSLVPTAARALGVDYATLCLFLLSLTL
ncbi:D-alanine--D-alanine ligase [Amphibiibacter pelophylacis]|uniref:D-alanine--D-alanine ligase n=1 Tax=Amphibiibacter pelophylacis TaxID=1799477 RepID=A0ACC6P5I8_9BURK